MSEKMKTKYNYVPRPCEYHTGFRFDRALLYTVHSVQASERRIVNTHLVLRQKSALVIIGLH